MEKELILNNGQTHNGKNVAQGCCPNCGSDKLSYGSSYPQDDNYVYEWTCDNCNIEGKEYNALTFVGHNIYVEE